MRQVVIKVGGAVCRDPRTVTYLARGLGALTAAGVRVTMVHGGGPQLDAALAALGEPPVKHRGLRVTSIRAAAVVESVLDAIGADMAETLTKAGVPARHVPAKARRFVARVKELGDGFDLGRVGSVDAFHPPEMPRGAVAVVTPVGADADGPLNVNADEAAGAVAGALAADALLLVTDVAHVRGAQGEAIPTLNAEGARRLIADGTAGGGMIPKLESALFALDRGVGEVWIGGLSTHDDVDLMAARLASGTRVVAQLPPLPQVSL